jgi:hypothetical protein
MSKLGIFGLGKAVHGKSKMGPHSRQRAMLELELYLSTKHQISPEPVGKHHFKQDTSRSLQISISRSHISRTGSQLYHEQVPGSGSQLLNIAILPHRLQYNAERVVRRGTSRQLIPFVADRADDEAV